MQADCALVAPHGECGALAEPAVDRTRRVTGAAQQELQHRDVPADIAADDRPVAEKRPPERAESLSCLLAGDPVRGEPGPQLKDLDGARRRRPADRVDLPGVEVLGAQGDLQPRGLGVDGGPGLGRKRDGCRQRSGAENGAETHRGTPLAGDGENPSPPGT